MILKCKMCGGDMEYTQGASVMECPYCGTNQTLPKVDDERLAQMHSRANHLRLMKEFDKAQMIYEEIIAENPKDAEAHWCALLCRYGIEYVEDPYSRERKPTMHRMQFDAITEDAHYLSAVEHADSVAREMYEHEAQLIDRIRRRYLSIASKEEPFDVFICYKETGADGQRTKDSVYAQEIYNELTREGYKVFFARITLEDKLGEAYEPYIFAALGSAKVMLVVGTSAAHMQAEWVKNEWKRYLYLMKRDSKKKIIPVYRDMEAYDMPEEFVYMQAQDYGKIGALQDLVRGVEKIVGKKQSAQTTVQPVQQVVRQTVVQQQGAGVESLMERAMLFLEDGDFKSAKEYLNRVLDINPKYAPAYFGKVMVEYEVRKEDQFTSSSWICIKRFEDSAEWKKAIRFADPELRKRYEGYLTSMQHKRKERRIQNIIDRAYQSLREAKTAEECMKVCSQVEEIQTESKAQWLIQECEKKAESITNAAYTKALGRLQSANKAVDFIEIRRRFELLGNYRDSEMLAKECEEKERAARKREEEKAEAKRKAEAEQRERKRQEEERSRQIAQAQKRRQITLIVSIMVLTVAIVASYVFVIGPMLKYNSVEKLISQGEYEEAEDVLTELAEKNYKDAAQRIGEPYYVQAEKLLTAGDAYAAAEAFVRACAYSDAQNRACDAYYAAAEVFEEQEKPLMAALAYRKSGRKDALLQADELTDGRLSMGRYHAVGTKDDGTVVAAGTNVYGQCDVGGWKDVVAVSAGETHVVGLKADGTVVAVGDNDEGQCDVGSWKNIVAVSAGTYHTVGMRADGTVVAVGRNEDGQCGVGEWQNIVAISAGDMHTVGLMADGTVVAAHDGRFYASDVTDWQNIVAVSAGTYHTVGVKADGTVVAVGADDAGQCKVGGWKDIVAVSAGTRHTVGLKADGRVVAVGDNFYHQCKVGSWVDIVAVSAGETDTVGLKADGTVIAAGYYTNDKRCDVSDWDLDD